MNETYSENSLNEEIVISINETAGRIEGGLAVNNMLTSLTLGAILGCIAVRIIFR